MLSYVCVLRSDLLGLDNLPVRGSVSGEEWLSSLSSQCCAAPRPCSGEVDCGLCSSREISSLPVTDAFMTFILLANVFLSL